jgi:hypothetical protein
MLRLPPALAGCPFTPAEARAAGLRQSDLRSVAVESLFRGVFVPTGLELTPAMILRSLRKIIPRDAVASRTTAALIHGIDVRRKVTTDVEVTQDRAGRLRPRPHVVVRQALLPEEDVWDLDGVLVTSPIRTAFDLARQPDRVESVVGIDAFAHAGLVTVDELLAYIEVHPGWRGVRTARLACDLAEPLTESSWETRLRLVLVYGGLPRPRVQIEVRNRWGILVARLDMGYDEVKIGVEFDGRIHEGSLTEDRTRDNAAADEGWWLRRYTSSHLGGSGRYVVDQVARAFELRRAG